MIEASVVIPARGRTALLARALRLLDGQRGAAFESIVVADRCPATTRAVSGLDLAHRCRLYEIPGPPNAPFGAAEARNVGARFARGRLLVFLDADCFVGPDHVAGFVSRFEPDGLWIGPIDFVTEEDWTKPLADELRPAFAPGARPPDGAEEAAWLGAQCWTGNLAVDRRAFLSLGGFDLGFAGRGGEDVDYGLRHAARFGRVARAPSRVRHVGATAAFAHARGEAGPLDATGVATAERAGRYAGPAEALAANGGPAWFEDEARWRGYRDLRADRPTAVAEAPDSSDAAAAADSVTDVFRAQIERGAAVLVAIARRVDHDRPLAGGEARFLALYAKMVLTDPDVFARVWSDPQAHAWAKGAFQALETLVRGPAGARADARSELASSLDAFAPFALAAAHLAGGALALPRGFAFAGRLPLPALPITLVADGAAELRGIAADRVFVARRGDPGPGEPLPLDAPGARAAGVEIERCPTLAWRGETIRLQPSVFASPLAVGRRRVEDAGVAFQAQHVEPLAAALRIVARFHPDAAALSERLRVVAFNAPGTSQLGNTSSSELPGAVALLPTNDPWPLSETLVHELHHQRLFAFEMEGPIFATDEQNAARDLRHYSPWRVEPRPMKGVLHAFYVFEAVARHWCAVLEAGEAEPRDLARERLALLALQLPRARETIRRHARLSPRGQRLFEESERRLDASLARIEAAGLSPPSPDPADRARFERIERDVSEHARRHDTARAAARLRSTLRFDVREPAFSDSPTGVAPRVPTADAPRVSCLCVTRGRVDRLARAVAAFAAQTHARRELVIVHEDDDRETVAFVESLARSSAEIVPVRVPREPRLPLGELRNRAVAASRGDWVCQWDDDDGHQPERIAAQLRAVSRHPDAVACVLSRWIVFDESAGRAFLGPWRDWEGSLLCRRDAIPAYPPLARGEDTPVVEALARQDRLVRLERPELYVYVVHGSNTFPGSHFAGYTEASFFLGEARSAEVAEMLSKGAA